MLKLPDFLQKDDEVIIVSPSGPINKSYIDNAVSIMSSWGLRVDIAKHCLNKNGTFAGSDNNRLLDLQNALNSKKYKAIICSRGGFGAIRIAPYLDYTEFLKQPKWVVGFSDITTLHSQINSLNVCSIHGAMPKNFDTVTPESLESLRNILFGEKSSITFAPSKYNRNGKVTGELIGGNLSILYSLRGIPLEYDYTGKILFIEDLNEYLYHIDRMWQNFKHSGILSQIAGLVVGTMSDMKQGADPYDATIEEIILDSVSEFDYPVCFDFPCGHDELHQSLILGSKYQLDVTKNNTCTLTPV